MKNDKIMLIDGNSIVNRAFYGIPLLTNSEGIYTNAIYGFLNILFKLLEEDKPNYIAVAFDLKAPTFRHVQYEDYKGTRKKMPDELRSQMPVLKEVLSSMNICIFEREGFEADDILGTVAKKAEKIGLEVVVVSGDKDLLQVASDKIKIKIPKTKGGKTEVEEYYDKDVVEKYGVTPTQFIDVKALMGDASDNVKGVPGIGEKTAINLIKEYDNLNNILEKAEEIKNKKVSENLKTYKEQALMSKFLVTIHLDMEIEVDLTQLELKDFINKDSYLFLKRLGFRTILEKFYQQFSKVIADMVMSNDENKPSPKHSVIGNERHIIELIENIQKQKKFSIVAIHEDKNLIGISICIENETFWVKPNEEINENEIFKHLKVVFEDDNIQKIINDVKYLMHFIDKYDIQIKTNYFDTMIGAYILNPTSSTYFYTDIAKEFLNELLISEEELLGKGKSKKSFKDLQETELIEYANRCCDTIYRAKNIIEQKINKNNQQQLCYEIEFPLIKVLHELEKNGIKIDLETLAKYGEFLDEKLKLLENSIYSMAGEIFNINSPKQLGVILFEKLNLPVVKKTKTGYSTDAEVLEKLSKKSDIVNNILEYRQLIKLKTTYVDGIFNVTSKDTNRIYSTFNQTVTATGRISSTEPNLQNIPIRLELGKQIRKVFIPSDSDYVLLDADYSQIELRVLAHISEDENLINAFETGQDIHRLTASQVFNTKFEEVTDKQRSAAKAINFGIIYGMGAFSLSQDLGITKKQAEEYIESYFAKYKKVKEYMNKTIEEAKEKGYVTTVFNRIRLIPELNSSNFMQRSFGERVVMNTPIQGTAADIIKIAMIKVSEKLKEKHLKSKLILQVHDELLIDVYKPELEEVKVILRDCMEHAVDLKVIMKVDMHTGNNWFEAK